MEWSLFFFLSASFVWMLSWWHVCVVLLEDFSVCWHNVHASLSSSKFHTGCRSIFVLLLCNFLTLKLVFHNHWTPWLFLVNLTHLPVPPLKFPNPAPVLELFTTLSSSFQPFLPLDYLHGMFFEFCVKLTEQIV